MKLKNLKEKLKIPDYLKKLIPEVPAEKADKIKDGAFAVREYVSENFIVFIIGAVCIVIVLLLAVLVAMNFGGMKTRSVSIVDISGEASFIRDSRSFTAIKNVKLGSGDTITVGDGGRVRLKIDPDKILTVEENTSLYIDYTEIEGRGAISVNLLYGSVISRLDNPIAEKDLFAVVTPNATVETKDAVFRTSFDFYDDYAEGLPAKITEIEDFSGNLSLQLYDDGGGKSGPPMIQTEKTTATMITMPAVARFGALNLGLELTLLSEDTLSEVLKISGERPTAYEITELNNALKAVVAANYPTETVPTIPTDINTEQIIITASTLPPPPTQATVPDIETTSATPEVIETVPTTAQTFGEYTEYTGEKWWMLPGTTRPQTEPAETTPPFEE